MTNLTCSHLSKSFDGVPALVDVTFEFPLSSVIAIIGPNGAGKTTLLNVLTGFLKTDEGRVFVGNQDVTNYTPARICQHHISRTFQDLRVITEISVLENVLLAYPCQKGERLLTALFSVGLKKEEDQLRSHAVELLRSIGLDEMKSYRTGELSYGQQKLLTLACCVATGAQILLFDEPLAGVDPQMVLQVLNLFQQLRKDGKLIIFIEHDITAVRQIAEFVIVMDEGRIIAHGKPAEILSRTEILSAYVG